jgi:hypothetical protein
MACRFVLFDPFNSLRIWRLPHKPGFQDSFEKTNCTKPGNVDSYLQESCQLGLGRRTPYRWDVCPAGHLPSV